MSLRRCHPKGEKEQPHEEMGEDQGQRPWGGQCNWTKWVRGVGLAGEGRGLAGVRRFCTYRAMFRSVNPVLGHWEFILLGMAKSTRLWPLFTWAVSQGWVCKWWSLRHQVMFPPWQRADLFLACWNRVSAPSSEFLSCNAKRGHVRLSVLGHPWHICGKWGWGAFGDRANTAHCFCGSDTIFCLWCGRLVSSINIHETSMLIHVWAFKEGEISLLDQMPLTSGRTGHQGEETAKPVRRLLHWVGGCLGLAVFKLSHKIQSLWSFLLTSTKLALCTLADGTVYFSRWYSVFTGTFCYQLASSLFTTCRVEEGEWYDGMQYALALEWDLDPSLTQLFCLRGSAAVHLKLKKKNLLSTYIMQDA